MRWLSLLLLSLGCRQLLGIEHGDVVVDAEPSEDMGAPDGDGPIANGHDEDSDGVPDAMDNCPTIANPSQSTLTAGESVGDACDPRTAGGDRVAVFFSFEQPQRPSDLTGGQTFEGDHATISSGGELATKDQLEMTRCSVIVSNTLPVIGAASIELRFGTITCRLGPCSGTGMYCLQAVGLSSTSETDAVFAPTFRFDITQVDGNVTCELHTPTATTMATANTSSIQEERLRVRATGVTATIDSLIVYDAP